MEQIQELANHNDQNLKQNKTKINWNKAQFCSFFVIKNAIFFFLTLKLNWMKIQNSSILLTSISNFTIFNMKGDKFFFEKNQNVFISVVKPSWIHHTPTTHPYIVILILIFFFVFVHRNEWMNDHRIVNEWLKKTWLI